MTSITASLFLANWSDVQETESQNYIDYETLINSDDEFLILESFNLEFDDEF